MQSLLLQHRLPKNPSLQTFNEYRETEARSDAKSLVAVSGEILEYETLELRIHPPNVNIDNQQDATSTVVTIDSANRPGTLVEVVQHFTELGLRINKARISSDGGWFHDMFAIVENGTGGKVRNTRKLNSIVQMLSITQGPDGDVANADETDDMERVETTVFELAGEDQHGLLADVTQLLTTNGCDVRSAAVWTHRTRVAFVVSVTEKGRAVCDEIKLQRLQQLLTSMMDQHGQGIVKIQKVKGEIHHERRLHRLLLIEEEKELNLRATAPPPPTPETVGDEPAPASHHSAANPPSGAAAAAPDSAYGTDSSDSSDPLAAYRSPKHSRPEVDITHCNISGYWLVTIKCKDRSKLLFDTVCTLSDLDYDVYHGTIDLENNTAFQEYYIRPRMGGVGWDAKKAERLRGMLESSIQRRFPKGLKVHVHSVDRFGCLAAITRELKSAGLTITRAKVKTYASNNSSGHTFYVMDRSGGPPDNRERVEDACVQIGGRLVEPGEEEKLAISGSGSHRFSFSFLHRQWAKGWGGSPCSSHGSL